MRRLELCIFLLFVFGGPGASAHDVAARVEVREAGTYQLEIALYDARPNVLRPVRFTVRALPGRSPLDQAIVTALGVPGPETYAVPTRVIRLQPAVDLAGGYTGALLLSVRGGWDLEVRVAGPAGPAVARVAVSVTAPRVVPGWVGWMIGLSPLLGLAWFAWWQRRYLIQLKTEETLRPPDPSVGLPPQGRGPCQI